MAPPSSLLAPLRTPRMAPVDVAWLRMEHPTNLMMVTALLSFDEPLVFDRVRAVVEERLLPFRRFRERVVERGRLRRRLYREIDPHFEPTSHLLRIALPAPGDEQALRELVSHLMATPLDASKPRWQIHLIESFGSGSALLVRIHHCVADGLALMHVLLSLTDDRPNQEIPPGTCGTEGGLLSTASEILRQELDLLVHPKRLLGLARCGAAGAPPLRCAA